MFTSIGICTDPSQRSKHCVWCELGELARCDILPRFIFHILLLCQILSDVRESYSRLNPSPNQILGTLTESDADKMRSRQNETQPS